MSSGAIVTEGRIMSAVFVLEDVAVLVDEYRPMIQPAALGAGLPLFKDLPAPLHLELVEAITYATGPAIHVYRPR
jgi:hypothetical protein